MKNKNTIAIVLLLTIAVTALAFGSLSSTTSGLFNFTPKVQAQTAPQISSQVLYDQVFRLVISFKKKAELQEQNGENPTSFLNYFKEEAQLNNQENEILQQVAAEFIQEVQPIDAQANAAIAKFRNPPGRQSPPPIKELSDLQEERDNLAVFYRNRLDELLGSSKFGELNNFVQGPFASNFQPFEIPTN